MSNGTIVQCIGAVVDIQFPRDSMPKIYDALTLADDSSVVCRSWPDLRSAAAVGRRRGSHHRHGLLRRLAPRHGRRRYRRPDLGAGRLGHAGPHHGRAGSSHRRSRPHRDATNAAPSTRAARVSTSCRLRSNCSKPASRLSIWSARSPRAARSACSAAPAWARP